MYNKYGDEHETYFKVAVYLHMCQHDERMPRKNRKGMRN